MPLVWDWCNQPVVVPLLGQHYGYKHDNVALLCEDLRGSPKQFEFMPNVGCQLTHLSLDKMATISQTILKKKIISNIFIQHITNQLQTVLPWNPALKN